MGLALSMVGAVFLAFNQVLNRSLKDTPAAVIVFFHSIGGIIMLATYTAIDFGINDEARDYTMR